MFRIHDLRPLRTPQKLNIDLKFKTSNLFWGIKGRPSKFKLTDFEIAMGPLATPVSQYGATAQIWAPKTLNHDCGNPTDRSRSPEFQGTLFIEIG